MLICTAARRNFGIQEAAWQSENPSGYANMFLTIDFTPEDDWSMSTRFLPQEWPGFSQEQIRTYDAKLEKRAVPAMTVKILCGNFPAKMTKLQRS